MQSTLNTLKVNHQKGLCITLSVPIEMREVEAA
jgi:hypothetical protein